MRDLGLDVLCSEGLRVLLGFLLCGWTDSEQWVLGALLGLCGAGMKSPWQQQVSHTFLIHS